MPYRNDLICLLPLKTVSQGMAFFFFFLFKVSIKFTPLLWLSTLYFLQAISLGKITDYLWKPEKFKFQNKKEDMCNPRCHTKRTVKRYYLIFLKLYKYPRSSKNIIGVELNTPTRIFTYSCCLSFDVVTRLMV